MLLAKCRTATFESIGYALSPGYDIKTIDFS